MAYALGLLGPQGGSTAPRAVCFVTTAEVSRLRELALGRLSEVHIVLLDVADHPETTAAAHAGFMLLATLDALSSVDCPDLVLLTDDAARLDIPVIIAASRFAFRGAAVVTLSRFAIDARRPWLVVPSAGVIDHLGLAVDLRRRTFRRKRLFDLVVATTLLTLFVPLFALIAVAIKLEDGHSVFFAQERLGRLGSVFRCLKFRTMRPNAEAQPPPELRQPGRDPRVTRVGRVLRKYRLDELPQLINVLKGEMSIIGPRPLVMRELYGADDAVCERSLVRPGITGWAQVNGGNILTVETKLMLDLWYIRRLSMRLELSILLRTIRMIVRGDEIGTEAIEMSVREA